MRLCLARRNVCRNPVKVRFESAPRSERLRTPFEPGQTYYLKFEVGAFGPKMAVVDEAVGANEIKNCNLIAESK